jgi:hypothetical protein
MDKKFNTIVHTDLLLQVQDRPWFASAKLTTNATITTFLPLVER